MEEWKEYKLGDVCSRLRSGKGIKADSVFNTGKYPVIGGNGVRGYADESNFEGQAAVIGRQGAYCGNVRFFEGEAYMTEHAVVAVGNEHADTRFLACLLSLMHLGNLSAQSAQPGISVQTLSKQLVCLPSIYYQRKVSAIIKSLDDKIELNRNINANLEAQAQALFKSWFVDFEPFKDQPFVESELGMIPKGWRVGNLSSFGKVICGKTPSKAESSYYGGDIPFIKIPDMHNKVFVEQSEDNLSQLGDESQSAKRIPPYSILVSCIATVGLVCINTKESHTNQQINTIIPDFPIFRYYLYQKLLSIKDYLINLGRGGTATLNVNTKTFGNIKIVKPQDDVLSEYEKLVTPLFNKIERNQQESRRLAELRDTLLPKLMSGEIKIIEKAL